ncbi:MULTISPECIES: 3-methyl-2-oxobutanoate hydroxymethyltransferase [Desulfococcus]|jgi:3-methyl-2-oxobutanoate hydroxymethyltransferase|uniref:3-methyl-2-oxobutanoate hydroxymethyltransferase n=1 Tax=Desulfococcus multivorans DSM 2059 TaxID=1121405 RepID=S7TGY8_DESML|nr:3-methyl-2-oxobutanoate hydroxymethyltransferase [Desulfococcus multivorans]AOY59866.1 PanB: 3-methyl-2-oxobutanoate hydroxymethyltransferase [Desulfococcus multivorans]AQV02027.1 3-methyl-2-oxobutanoate hydroxymethyltransferase [Desulfococcus multivorans]EPR35865.1 3-methyl-2-oxobutanoate hydroxymethyltransferase [Desulfococcus multivorans DSM 2059]MDX9818643.1 3-methyl-2-oxobutanoate hydroxymethyltransferase [Desulfococcus multivorans]SJZ34317.1 ketopantoate hydroxymethyltransferase [Desu
MTRKTTIVDIKARKKTGPPITMLTAYDYPMALLVDRGGIDMILVGDSLGMVVLGYPDTISVTMDEMVHHTKAVSRVAEHALVVSDLPFGAYNVSIEKAVENANRIMKEGRADAVKLEGGRSMASVVEAVVRSGTPVQGHIGLTPQTASALGGFKVQGKSAEAARTLIDDAKALEAAGCFSIVLEAIPAPIAQMVTEALAIPTIGIGAGVHCDGQVLVIHDMVGLFDRFTPKFVKQYAKVSDIIASAISAYADEVKNRRFPEERHSFTMKTDELDKLEKA